MFVGVVAKSINKIMNFDKNKVKRPFRFNSIQRVKCQVSAESTVRLTHDI